MEYRNSYISPLGRILLTADEIGLTGLAFEGQKNAVQGLIRESEEKETTLFSGVKNGWIYIFQEWNRTFKYRFIWKEPIFRCVCGRCFARSRMERQRHTAQSQSRSHMTEGFQRCRVRRLEMLSDATLCR